MVGWGAGESHGPVLGGLNINLGFWRITAPSRLASGQPTISQIKCQARVIDHPHPEQALLHLLRHEAPLVSDTQEVHRGHQHGSGCARAAVSSSIHQVGWKPIQPGQRGDRQPPQPGQIRGAWSQVRRLGLAPPGRARRAHESCRTGFQGRLRRRARATGLAPNRTARFAVKASCHCTRACLVQRCGTLRFMNFWHCSTRCASVARESGAWPASGCKSSSILHGRQLRLRSQRAQHGFEAVESSADALHPTVA